MAGALLSLAGGAQAASGSTRPVIAELFTSQGCSSCPPADQIFGELAQAQDVITLTYHVDYWDYLGWRDTLASQEFSQRQYDYAKSRGDMDVYTPQAIINGREHLVGSNKTEVERAIVNAKAATQVVWVDFMLETHGPDLTFKMPASPDVGETTLWLLAVTPSLDVEIERGENAGRTMTYSNVVRRMQPAAMWQGDATKIMMPRDTVMPKGSASCVALLQQGKVGPVIGAARIDHMS